jgi:asparagine synthase (glutamine-hydrolysing)
VDSTIVALEAIESGAKTSAYSAFWPNPDKSRYNTDSNTARNIAEKLGIHFELVQMIDVSEVEKELVRFVHAMHEPNNNPTGVSMMRLYEKISTDGHRLVLTGDGADEIFAGYKRYNIIRKIPNLFRINPDFLGNSLFLDSLNDGKITRKLAQSQANPDHINSWLSWHTVFSPIELLRLLADPASKGLAYNEIQNKLTGLSRSTNLRDKVEIMMHRDSLIWLTMESNRKLDRISMHYSIEARSPFQDDFVRSSAAKIMQDSGYKQLNKSFLWKDYPELKVLGVRKDKAGFISPLGHWLRGNRKIIENSFEILSQDRRFSIPELIRLKDAPWNRNYREISQLWTLIVLAYWMQENE